MTFLLASRRGLPLVLREAFIDLSEAFIGTVSILQQILAPVRLPNDNDAAARPFLGQHCVEDLSRRHLTVVGRGVDHLWTDRWMLVEKRPLLLLARRPGETLEAG